MVVWRLVAPPAVPSVIRPRSPDRSEHVPAHDRGADARVTLSHKVVVEPALAPVHPVCLTGGPGGEGPFVQAGAALAERIVDALVGPGDVSVERHRQVVD